MGANGKISNAMAVRVTNAAMIVMQTQAKSRAQSSPLSRNKKAARSVGSVEIAVHARNAVTEVRSRPPRAQPH